MAEVLHQHAVSPLPVLLSTAHCQTLDGTHVGLCRLAYPAELALGQMGIHVPVLDALGQAFGLLARIVFAVHLVVASEQPIDITQRAPAGIHTHNGSAALVPT